MYMHIFMNIYTHVCYIHYHTYTDTRVHREKMYLKNEGEILWLSRISLIGIHI